jgi:acyl transferase domain-containing protein
MLCWVPYIMDPQQRLLLEGVLEAGAAAASAGGGGGGEGWFARFGKLGCDGGITGVYVGVGSCEYHDYVLRPHGQATHGLVATGNALSVNSGRISYMFGFSGRFNDSFQVLEHVLEPRFCR